MKSCSDNEGGCEQKREVRSGSESKGLMNQDDSLGAVIHMEIKDDTRF
jgi:hypothetical protein